jgi:hypothetical protein
MLGFLLLEKMFLNISSWDVFFKGWFLLIFWSICSSVYFEGEGTAHKVSWNYAAINGHTDVSGIKLHFENIKDHIRKPSDVRLLFRIPNKLLL